MVYWKIIAGILLAMLVTGCQAPASGAGDTLTGSALSQKDTGEYFLSERRAAISSILSQADNACGNAGQPSADNQCIRKTIFEAFGSSSAAKTACEKETSLAHYGNCITMNALADDLQLKLAPENRFTPTDEDLRTPESYLRKVVTVMESQARHDCATKSGSELDRCQRDVIKRISDLPESYKSTCEALSDSEQNGECFGKGVLAAFSQKAADRLKARSAS